MKKRSTALVLKILTLIVLSGLLVNSLSTPARAAPLSVPSGERLRNLAGSFLIGYASMSNFAGQGDSAIYQETARTEFNFLTPENDLKFGIVHPQQNTFNFGPADQHFQFAQANGMAFHGHTLIWHSQNPDWLTNGSWTPATLTAVMNNHIDTVMNHYPDGAVLVWDVVNEAFQDGNGNLRSSVWLNTLGQQYIEMAFRRARMNDSQTKLIYNDFNIDTLNSKSDAVFAMVSDFRNRGVPIDGVGLQMHLTSSGIDGNSLAQNMARFANLGLEIYITEMDVRYPTPISQANLTAQANVYRTVLDRCRAQPMCKALQIWGFTDAHSWVPQTFQGQGDALIFDASYNPKPAYFALQAGMGGGGPTATPTRTPTRTNTPIGPTNTPTRTPTGVPPTNTPTGTPTACTNTVLQAENASFGGGATADSNNAGFTGTGFINFNASGAFVQFNNVNGGTGGTTTVRVRYALGAATSRTGQLTVNGASQNITFTTTGSWASWAVRDLALPLNAGTSNTIRFQSTGQDLANIDQIEVVLCGTAAPTNTPTSTPTRTNTPIGPTATPTNTPIGPTATPTRTPTPGGGACSPVTSTIAAPFAFDGAGTFCWQTSNLGSFVNSWNLASLTINGVDFTNRWAASSSYPPPINGFWFVSYTGNFPWSHFEAR